MRPEPDFDTRRSESEFELERGFDVRRADPVRSESTFEPRRPEPSRPEPAFEPPHSDNPLSEQGFEARPAFEPREPEHGFDLRRPEPADDAAQAFEPRRASRAEPAMDATRVDTAAVGASFRSEPARREPAHESPTTIAAPASRAAAGGSGSSGGGSANHSPNQEWPITPLPGEPPLTLFRGKRLVELEPGTEFDRFGDDEGNLAYAVGTPFHERSLVPEWVERPYHAYLVREPVQVLTGTAIPWFDQPGGGTAYLLPDAIGDLLATGRIVEVNGRERPPA